MSEAASSTTPLLLCIDVEPDSRLLQPGLGGAWIGYEKAMNTFRRVRAEASHRSGAPVHFNWFYRMDPQIALAFGSAAWLARRYERETSEWDGSGDAIGLHTHAFRFDGYGWTASHDDQAWLDECLETSAAAYAQAFGRPCRVFRSGDRWMSQRTMELLQSLGARYDLTLEPGQPAVPPQRRAMIGAIPDYSGIPENPYRPSRSDFRIADPQRRDGLLLIPLTTAAVRPRLLRDVYYLAAYGWRRARRWTALLSHDPLLFRRIVTDALQRGVSHLALAVQTGTLAHPRYAIRIADNLQWLLAHPSGDRFRWMTPEELDTAPPPV